jgi:hypothetical protein
VRIIVPFVTISPETRKALDASGYPWEGVDVSSSLTAYWEALSDLWGYGETFCVVEHDIVVGPSTLSTFESCLEPWCGSPYPYLSGMYAGLGCTRFRAEFIVDLPNAIEKAGEINYPNHGQRHWCTTDDALKSVLSGYGKTMCLHEKVDHVGDQMPSHLICRPS